MTKKARVFISHAAADKVLADALVDLLQLTINLRSEDTFCSSLEGMDIPAGKSFIDYIKGQIQSPEAVVVLLTPNYLASPFCLAELGATWAMTHNMLPILVPPLNYGDLRGVLTVTQVEKIHEGLTKIAAALSESLSLELNHARWEAKKKDFLERLPSILDALPKPKNPSRAEYEALAERLRQSAEALDRAERELGELKELNKDLVACKDAEQVAKVQREHAGVDGIQTALSSLREALAPLPAIVGYVMFRTHIGTSSNFDPYRDKDCVADAERAVQDGRLRWDNGFELNANDPLVKKARKALKETKKYLDSEEVTEEMVKAFEEAHEYLLSLEIRALWKDYLVPGIGRYE